MKTKLGKVCKYGQLARSWEICELPARVQELEAANHEKENLIITLEAELKGLKEQVDFERNKAGHLEWVEGQRAIQALDRITLILCDEILAEEE